MQRASFADIECPIARCLDQIGDGWSLMVLRTAFLGRRTFQEFEDAVGVPPSTLTRKLKELTGHGLLERVRYSDHPPRGEYLLTDKGRDLMPLLLSMATFGNKWLSPAGPPTIAIDVETGDKVVPMLVDKRTGREIKPGSIAIVPGRGASKALRERSSTPVVFGKQDDKALRR